MKDFAAVEDAGVSVMVLSPDGKTLATGFLFHGTIKLWAIPDAR